MKIIEQNITSLIRNSFCIKKNDKTIIIYDKTTQNILKYFFICFKKKKLRFDTQFIKCSRFHGSELPSKLKKKLINYSVIICLTKYSFAHSQSRKITIKTSRFFSMPAYNQVLLKHKSLTYNFKKSLKIGKFLKKIMDRGREMTVFFDKKHFVIFKINQRKSNLCPGYANVKGQLASPPDSEINISPIEKKTNGYIIIRNSVTTPDIGKLSSPIKLKLVDGYIKEIETSNYHNKKKLIKLFLGNKKKKMCAEIGIGLNPYCTITGNMLTDEGRYGFVHFGFGSNFSVGGKNKVNFHIDFVTSNLKLFIDNKLIIENNKINIK